MNNLKEAFFDLYTRLVEKIHEHRELRDDIADDIDTKSFENGAIFALKQAMKAVQEVYEKELIKANGWISVDDKLPKDFEKVLLLCDKYGEKTFQEIGYFNPELAKNFDRKESFSIHAFVTHWQYLPDEPKELTTLHEV